MIRKNWFHGFRLKSVLGISPRTLAVWACVKRYELPYVKIGRLVKYRRSVLDDFIERRTIT